MARHRKPTTAGAPTVGTHVTLTAEELELLCAALDSHIYWELSDQGSRASGYADNTSVDDETTAEIEQAESLLRRLEEQRSVDDNTRAPS